MITLDRFILEEERQHPGATGELSMLLMRFGVAGKRIAWELAVGGLKRQLGSAGKTNVSGEEQEKLDVLANEILIETFDYGGLVSVAASEEMEKVLVYPRNSENGRYAVLFDPMDGSSNIAVNGTLGTIFSIRPRGAGEADLLRSGREQVAAGYILFGPATLLVYTCGDGVRLFTLEPSIGEFLLTREGLCRQRRALGRLGAADSGFCRAPETGQPGRRPPLLHPLLGLARRGLPSHPPRGRHLSLSGGGRQAVGQAASPLRVSSARLRRRARRWERDDRNGKSPRRRARLASRAHPLRHRQRRRGGPLRELRPRRGDSLEKTASAGRS